MDFLETNRSIPRSSIVGGHQIEMGRKAAESNKNGKPGLEAVDASRQANKTQRICGTSKSLPKWLNSKLTTGSWEFDFVETQGCHNARSLA